MMASEIRVEKHYYVDDARRVGLVIGGEMVTILSAEKCFAVADDLVAAGESLLQADGGSDDEERRCPKCGEPIRSVSVTGPSMAELHPCGHEIPADHPVLSDGGQ